MIDTIFGILGIVAALFVAEVTGNDWGQSVLAFIAIAIALILLPLTLQSLSEWVEDMTGKKLFKSRRKGMPR